MDSNDNWHLFILGRSPSNIGGHQHSLGSKCRRKGFSKTGDRRWFAFWKGMVYRRWWTDEACNSSTIIYTARAVNKIKSKNSIIPIAIVLVAFCHRFQLAILDMSGQLTTGKRFGTEKGQTIRQCLDQTGKVFQEIWSRYIPHKCKIL